MASIRPNGASFQPAHKRPHPRPLRRASRPSCEGCVSPLQDVERPAGTARSEVTIRKNLAGRVPERPRRPRAQRLHRFPVHRETTPEPVGGGGLALSNGNRRRWGTLARLRRPHPVACPAFAGSPRASVSADPRAPPRVVAAAPVSKSLPHAVRHARPRRAIG